MKNLILFCIFFLPVSLSGQQLTALVKSKIDEHCKTNLDRYKGNVNITDAVQNGNTMTVSGTFDYEYRPLIGFNAIRKYPFRCRLKTVLDDVIVDNFCYKMKTYIVPGDPPMETCECTTKTEKTCPN